MLLDGIVGDLVFDLNIDLGIGWIGLGMCDMFGGVMSVDFRGMLFFDFFELGDVDFKFVF